MDSDLECAGGIRKVCTNLKGQQLAGSNGSFLLYKGVSPHNKGGVEAWYLGGPAAGKSNGGLPEPVQVS